MKTYLILIACLFVSGIMPGQTQPMELVFTAQNIGQHIHLDSILIENCTQGVDTTLYDPDTVLVLDIPTGIDKPPYNQAEFLISQNHPNPVHGKTHFTLTIPYDGKVHLTVSDLAGRILINYSTHLQKGTHVFEFKPGADNFYLLTAGTGDLIESIKVINKPSAGISSMQSTLKYIGSQDYFSRYKNHRGNEPFVFTPGDMLIYTAFSDNGERKISDRPSIDKIYAFQYSGEPCNGIPYVYDIDGNVYNTVEIGTQCWMKENLKTTTYNNGTPVLYVPDTSWASLAHGAYVWYDNNSNWSYAYGALYNWYAVDDVSGLCPEGWVVPADGEWETLDLFSLGGEYLKSCRQINYANGMCNVSYHPKWETDNAHHGFDEYGFSGLPGGARFADGTFQHFSYYGYWWSSTEWITFEGGVFHYLYYISNGFHSFHYDKKTGFSVRCMKEDY